MLRSSLSKAALLFSVSAGCLIGTPVPQAYAIDFMQAARQQAATASSSALPSFIPADGVIIQNIDVRGAGRLEKDTILSYISLDVSDRATKEKLRASLKALYKTGLFADVRLRMEGTTLVVEVTENPIVNAIEFEGNDIMSRDELEKEVRLAPRLVYTIAKVQKDVSRLLDLYRRSGRFAAEVEPEIELLDQNRVNVIFKITEGDRTGVRRISFVGNEHYDDDTLRGLINSEETAWWKFFSTSDFYDPDRVTYDRELLRRFYLNEGYVDFHVISSVAEMTPDKKDFFLTFAVEEGKRYRFGKISLQSEIKGLDTKDLQEALFTKEGDFYSADHIEKTVEKMSAMLGDKQYAFVNIVPVPTKHDKEGLVDIVYKIEPSKQVYIGRIDISGNTRTIDKVIRREMLVAEGDPYSTSKIKRSEQKIKDLGFFKDVSVTPAEGAQPDRSDIKIKVEEQSTGEISLGAGFSSTDGPLGDFSIRERNFMGRGQDMRLGATISGSTKQLDFSFTEPHFMDRNFSAGVDVFHIRSDEQEESSYDEITTGFSLRGGYPISPWLRQVLSYTIRENEISDVDADASRFVREQEGKSLTSMVSQELIYDRRDSKVDPSEGYVTRLKTDFAGLGGDRHYIRARLTGTQYYSPADDYILRIVGEGAVIAGLGEDVHIADRFFLGGDDLRGFDYAGVGPRDLTDDTDDALGSNYYLRASVELSFPTFMPDNLGFKGHIFTDAAFIGDCQEAATASEIFKNEKALRASAGLGVSWQSPFGLVRLDYAIPFLKESYDEVEHIHFSFGTRF